MELTWISTAGHPVISEESHFDLVAPSLGLEGVVPLYLGPLGL